MRYRFTIQERDGAWIYVLSFGNDTPHEIEDIVAYSNGGVSAMDAYGVRHYAYTRDDMLVSIHLHDALRLFPSIDPARPETYKMPGMHAIMFGNPPVPTLLLKFREEPPDNRNFYAISKDVFMLFQGPELAELYVFDVYNVIAEVD